MSKRGLNNLFHIIATCTTLPMLPYCHYECIMNLVASSSNGHHREQHQVQPLLKIISCIFFSFLLSPGCVIEMGAILAPGTVLLPDTLIPTSQLWAGNPAVYIRDVTEAEVDKSEKVKFSRIFIFNP